MCQIRSSSLSSVRVRMRANIFFSGIKISMRVGEESACGTKIKGPKNCPFPHSTISLLLPWCDWQYFRQLSKHPPMCMSDPLLLLFDFSYSHKSNEETVVNHTRRTAGEYSETTGARKGWREGMVFHNTRTTGFLKKSPHEN